MNILEVIIKLRDDIKLWVTNNLVAISSQKADKKHRHSVEDVSKLYNELYKWADGNPDGEDRLGYFVTLNGTKIVKLSTTDDYILGVTTALKSGAYMSAYVQTHGKCIVLDDGTCMVNGYCMPTTGGVATKATTGYRVIERVNNHHIRVIIK